MIFQKQLHSKVSRCLEQATPEHFEIASKIQ